MTPRFIQRLERQTQVYRDYFGGEPKFDPPPYPASFSRSSSRSTTIQEAPPPSYEQISSPRTSSLETPAISHNSLVLVTGADGFEGSHIADQLLARGFRVRGTVVDSASAQWTSRYFAERYGPDRFTTTVISDRASQGAFDIAVKGCSGIIYCAAATRLCPDPTQVIPPSIAGAINCLEAAEKEVLVTRVVFSSSTAAAAPTGGNIGVDITSDSWNMLAFQNAWQAPPYTPDRIWPVHSSKEVQTEQTLWKYYNEHRPFFALNTVLPGTLWGQILSPKHQVLTPSLAILKLIWDGNAAAAAFIPPQHFVDVQDSALLHIAALLLPDIQNKRIFAAHTPYNINSVLEILRKTYPGKIFPGDVDHGEDMAIFKETAFAERLLHRMGKKGFTDIETSISQTCDAFH